MFRGKIPTIASFRQPIMYALVGIMNTAIGGAAIFVLMALGASPIAANAGGYALGFVTSFVLNSKITFQVSASRGNLIRFLVAVAIAYAANLAVMIITLKVTHSKQIAQAAGIPVYLMVGYIANKCWAMRG